MRAITAVLLSAATLLLVSILLAGCAATTAGGIQLQPGATGSPGAALGIDPATYVILDLERSGGFAGLDERAQVYLDGHVLLERRGQDPVTFQLTPAEQAQLSAALDAADFYRNAAQPSKPAKPAIADGFQYRVLRRGVLLEGVVETQDGSVPAWLDPLLPLLTNLLLNPDPARIQPYEPAATRVTPTATVTATVKAPAAPAIVLLEFVRSQPGQDARVLVNLDRTYSVAQSGVIAEGELTREEMAALLKLLETADLKTRAGDYTPAEPCADCASYAVTYRNLLGGATVRGEAGALPEWMQVLTATLEDAFLKSDLLVSTTPAAVAASARITATAVVTAAASPTATLSAVTATVAPAAGNATPTPVSGRPTAAPTPAAEPAYTALDLLADLAGQGAQVQAAPGRIVKPYLAASGVILRVDGQPLQVFQYADAAALAADVAGLAPNASSINGVPLAWPAAPHFWRKGGLLVLAVSDDAGLVELIDSVLGPAFAGPVP